MDTNLLQIPNFECFPNQSCGNEPFKDLEHSINQCLKENIHVFVVVNGTVYYKLHSLRDCVVNMQWSAQACMYICFPKEGSDWYVSDKDRIEYYTRGIHENQVRSLYKLSNTTCFPNDSSETFQDLSACIERCVSLHASTFVVSNNLVYYRVQPLEECLQVRVPAENSDMYVLSSELEHRLDPTQYSIVEVKQTFKPFRWSRSKLQEFLQTHTESDYGFLHYSVMLSYLGEDATFAFNINAYDLSAGVMEPTFAKSRPIHSPKRTVLIPLEQLYFPYFYAHIAKDDIPFECKRPSCVWRGVDSGIFAKQVSNRASRYELVRKYFNHDKFNIGLSGIQYGLSDESRKQYVKENMSIQEQLKYMFVLSVEGNDFATNLSWILLSNSVPIMPKPFIETWKLEHKLTEYVHYIPVKNDFSDLETQIEWGIRHLDKCKEIAYQSKLFVLQFLDPNREKDIVQGVLQTYKTTFASI